jgi:hypothetical protein
MEIVYIIGFIALLLLLRHFGLLPGDGKARDSTPETRQELDTDLLYGGGLTGEKESGESHRKSAEPGKHDG